MLPNDTDASLPVLQSLPPEVGLILQSLPFCVGARDIPAFLESISANLRIRKYSPSDVVIHHGDQPKAMFFVIKGVLKVTSEDSEVDIAELGPGAFCKLLFDLVGEIAVLFDIKRVATVVAKTGCSLAILLAEDLIPALVNHPDIELNMRAAAKSRIRVMHEEYTRLGKVFQSALFQFEDADQEVILFNIERLGLLCRYRPNLNRYLSW